MLEERSGVGGSSTRGLMPRRADAWEVFTPSETTRTTVIEARRPRCDFAAGGPTRTPGFHTPSDGIPGSKPAPSLRLRSNLIIKMKLG
jgi:hypothetical protein